MALRRVRTVFTGVAGTPWYNNMYFNDSIAGDVSNGSVIAVNNFWTAIRGALSDNVSWVVQGEVPRIDEATGDLIGISNVTPLGNTGSAADDELPFQTQALIRLNTSAFIHSRRLRGRIFVPALGESNNVGGLPTSTLRASLDAAAEALIADAAAPLVVWSRPFAGTPENPPRIGSFSSVDSSDVSVKWAVLRSRRD